MSYTKGEFIDQIYLLIIGGQMSPDVNVKRADIEAYLAQAINYITVKEIRQRKREDDDRNVDSEFYKTYYVTPIWDTVRHKYYVILPARLQLLPGGDGIGSVAPRGSDKPSVKMRSPYELSGIEHIIQQEMYWYEVIGNGDLREERLYFINLGQPTPEMMIRMIPSIESLSNNDIVSMPSGLEVEVLNLAAQWFKEQRMLPADVLNNNKDDKQ